MSNSAMSNETDLDWLARNVHEWVPNELLRMKPCDNGNGKLGASWCYSGDGGFTKDQWLARRAELQNKPGWNDAPEWAEWLVQDSWGCWGWFQYCPAKQPLAWIAINGYYSINSPGAEILGDWRDTLERRPEQQEEFQPFISIEDNQEQIMGNKQGDSWHERGELPPVGTECEVMHRESWVACDVIAHFQQRAAIVAAYTTWCGSVKDLDSCVAAYFRPIRTERDVLIEIIKKTDDTDDRIADAILAAGFKRDAA